MVAEGSSEKEGVRNDRPMCERGVGGGEEYSNYSLEHNRLELNVRIGPSSAAAFNHFGIHLFLRDLGAPT